MSSSISKSKFKVSQSASASPSLGFGLSLQTKVVMEICSELGYGVIDGVGRHKKCLRDRICPELQGGDIPLESEKVVEKGVPLQTATGDHDPAVIGGIKVDHHSSRTLVNIKKSADLTQQMNVDNMQDEAIENTTNTETPGKVTQDVEIFDTQTQPPDSQDPESVRATAKVNFIGFLAGGPKLIYYSK